jgi:reversibly glycosylated polypeptide/UDP-arabinopyranose mutase
MSRIDFNVFLVVPTIRDLEFLKEWEGQFSKVNLVVVEDGPETTVSVDESQYKSVIHYCWRDIERDLGENQWIISRKNAGVRNFGFWKAYEMGAEVIMTLDDDCFPVGQGWVEGHLANLEFRAARGWMTTYPDPMWMYTRGVPYAVRDKIPVMVSHGLWSGALDLDAKREVLLSTLLDEQAYPPIRQVIPQGYYYPMCSMNLAFRREVTPCMFFPMMGSDPEGKAWGYDRYDDIWAGILSKKVMDHLGWGVVNGSPLVEHRKRSEPGVNLGKERVGMQVNEDFWRWVEAVVLTETSVTGCYRELAVKVRFPRGGYFDKLREAMVIWANLFDD